MKLICPAMLWLKHFILYLVLIHFIGGMDDLCTNILMCCISSAIVRCPWLCLWKGYLAMAPLWHQRKKDRACASLHLKESKSIRTFVRWSQMMLFLKQSTNNRMHTCVCVVIKKPHTTSQWCTQHECGINVRSGLPTRVYVHCIKTSRHHHDISTNKDTSWVVEESDGWSKQWQDSDTIVTDLVSRCKKSQWEKLIIFCLYVRKVPTVTSPARSCWVRSLQ